MSHNPTISTLSLLHQLPDPHEDLAPQTKLTAFPPFPRLPLELRQHIWRAAFPPSRTLRLDTDHYCTCCLVFQHKPTYPSTLWVCRESRAETLRLYRYFAIDVETEDLDRFYPMCFSPRRDNLYFTSYNLLWGWFRVWLAAFIRCQPAALDSVTELAIDFGVEKIGWCWNYGWTNELRDELRRDIQLDAPPPLFYFPHLETLFLVVTKEKRMGPEEERECKDELRAHFQRLRTATGDPGFQVPEIVVSAWDKPGRFYKGPQIDSSAFTKPSSGYDVLKDGTMAGI